MDADETRTAAQDQKAAAEATDRRLEILIAVVLAVAGLASAWASFQGGILDKQEAEGFALANSHLTESSQLLIRSGQEQAVGAGMFLQWLDAKSDGQTLRPEVIASHMPPWFAEEFARWRGDLPANLATLKPNSPLPVFKGPSLAGALEARAKSDAARRQADAAGRIGDSYDIANVILATALFLAGISSVLHRRSGRRLVAALAGLLTAGAVVSMMMTDFSLPF